MSPHNHTPRRAWTVAEAKARLSEILRLAEEEGPQRVDAPKPLGRWLVENAPRGTNLEIPRERPSDRETPFVEGDAD